MNAYQRYEEVLTDFARHIINFCVLHGENRADADDLIQEINVAVWKHIGDLHDDVAPRQVNRWLQRVMRTTYVRHLRSKMPFVSFDATLVDEPAVPADWAREVIDELSSGLDAGEQALLQLYLDGYSNGEMATRLGVTQAAVRKRLQRIRQKMTVKRKEIYG